MTMVPSILGTLGRQPNPDEAFSRFDRFVSALPAGVQPMSLFQHNPQLLDRIAAVLGAAPMLAEHLARNPNALDGLLETRGKCRCAAHAAHADQRREHTGGRDPDRAARSQGTGLLPVGRDA